MTGDQPVLNEGVFIESDMSGFLNSFPWEIKYPESFGYTRGWKRHVVNHCGFHLCVIGQQFCCEDPFVGFIGVIIWCSSIMEILLMTQYPTSLGLALVGFNLLKKSQLFIGNYLWSFLSGSSFVITRQFWVSWVASDGVRCMNL